MEIFKPFIDTRLQLLNSSESKDLIDDVIFTIKHSYGSIVNSNIYLTPYEGLVDYADKEKAVQVMINKILDKSFFKENNLEYQDFNLILFFSFDAINFFDNCYVCHFNDNNVVVLTHDLNGNLRTKKKLFEQKTDVVRNKEIKKDSTYYLFFDTETTGLPKNWKAPVTDLNNWPRLVQLAYLNYDIFGNKISGGDFIIKPEGFSIPIDASRIHGITTERALMEGQSIVSVLNHFNSLVGQATYLVAHNMSFDEKIIGAEFLRNGMNNPIPNKNKICTMERTTDLCAIQSYYGYKWPKLSELHIKLFGTDFEEAHNAAVDIMATAKCFWELKRLGKI